MTDWLSAFLHSGVGRPGVDEPDYRHRRLLRPCDERPRRRAPKPVCRSLRARPGHYATKLIATKIVELSKDGIGPSLVSHAGVQL
jgi:hypothetical protein